MLPSRVGAEECPMMTVKARPRARLRLLYALLFVFAGCVSGAADQGGSAQKEPVASDESAPASSAAEAAPGALANTELVVPETKVAEPEDAPRDVPVPETTRDPAQYAYASDMSPGGWAFGAVDPEEAASDTRGITQKKQIIDNPGNPDPLPVDPDAYYASIQYALPRQIGVRTTCTGTVQLARRVDRPIVVAQGTLNTRAIDRGLGFEIGGRTQIATVTCGQLYTDANLEPGVNYCYSVRPNAQKPYSAEVCQRTPYEPYKFDALNNSRAASEAMVKSFDWRKTEAVYAGTAQAPTLWYVNILSDYDYDLQALRALGIHTQTVPLFPDEQNNFEPSNDIVEVDGKLAGQWIYALMPGAAYNDMRTQMLEALNTGHVPGFRAVVFRSVPVSEARLWTGAISPVDINYVGKMGVEFNGYSSCSVVNGVHLCSTQQALVGWLLRKAYDFVADFVDDVVEGVRQIIGAVARLIKGDVTLTLRFKLMNTDAKFGTTNEVMSAWRNAPLVLRNTRVQLTQGLALFKGDTDASGVARIKVAKGWNGKICLELENNRVSFTNGWAESTQCVRSFSATNADQTIDVPVNNNMVNAFATMTDASEYVQTVMGYGMPRVKVLVGWAAEHSGGEEGQSFSPCLGMSPVVLSGLLDLGLTALFPPVELAAALAEAFYSVDIILKDTALGTRAVATHEFGHTVMCAMMRSASTGSADTALLDILAAYKGGNRKDPAKQQTYMTEAFADFITLQVAGGTNYVNPSDSRYTRTSNVAYCHAGSDCYETNLRPALSDWDGQLRRTISLLQDAFDDASANTSTPNDGSHWRLSAGTLVSDVQEDSNRSDEPFELVGSDMRQIYEHWADRGNTMREATFFGALGELMLERGYSHRDVCDLFAAHDENGACPDYILELATYCPPFDPAAVHDGFCRPGCCSLGEGDCNSDAECAPGLRCEQDNGALFGLASTVDLCTQNEALSVTVKKPSGTTLTVRSDKGGIVCSIGTCSTSLQHNETVTFMASRSVTWSGCARLSATQCRVQMAGARAVRATVESAPPPDDDPLPPVCKAKPWLPQCGGDAP
jgi:hypothetical protein